MRRQARISAGGALVVRTASALQVWLWLLIFIFQNEFRISRSIQPGYLDFDNLPETNFTCAGKVIGGYYADLETSCQMFHVCTVGQQDEPMDIKFLCLNGTVFDQETRVCERVDEVDCTKSEKFYSLNLELYGSTLPPPVLQDDVPKTQAQSTEQSIQKTKPSKGEPDPSIDESPTTHHDRNPEHSTDVIDSTEDPTQDIKKDGHKNSQSFIPTRHTIVDQDEPVEEYQDEDGDNVEYEEDYVNSPTTTSQAPSSSTTTTSTTTKRPPSSTTVFSSTTAHRLSPVPHLISSSSPTVSSIGPSVVPSTGSSAPSVDPALLSPQEFIYRHREPSSGAISFQSFRPADGVYITHAPPQQFDHFQYESSRTAPRPVQPRPGPFVQRPQPAPFRPTTLDPRDQLLRPGPASQSSERHETAIKHRPQSYPSVLPAQRPLPFNPYYYDRKRSDDISSHSGESSLAARSVAPPTVTEKPPTKPKSPPRVIVTASASVSDSNGKRLNYTVGNVVSAVKPIVPINYDDYKESDLIFDPFFLDVPKLQKRRKTRSYKGRRVISIPATATIPASVATAETLQTTLSPMKSTATTTAAAVTTKTTPTTTTVAWNPDDYVDDNYEPHAYMPPVAPPLAVLAVHETNKKQDKLFSNKVIEDKSGQRSLGSIEQPRLNVSAEPASSQSPRDAPAPPAAPPPPAQAAVRPTPSTDCTTCA